MSGQNNKTVKTTKSVAAYLADVKPEAKRKDCETLAKLFEALSGFPAQMWGPSLVGYGTYHYKYESGREGDFFRVGFAPRAQNITIYIMPGFENFEAELAELGKHKLGKSCLYVKSLADIDMDVLTALVRKSLDIMAEKYPL